MLRNNRFGGMGLLAMLAFLGAAGTAAAQADYREGRPRDAVEMCVQEAERILDERERLRDVEIEEITRADEDDDVVKVQGYLNVRDRDGDRREGWLDCDVSFEGENRIVWFDEDNLLRSVTYDRDRRRNRGGDRDRRGGGDLREDARAACRDMVESQGYEIADVRDQDRTDNGMRLEMRLRRGDNRFDAVCLYNRDRDSARFVRLEREGGRGRDRDRRG